MVTASLVTAGQRKLPPKDAHFKDTTSQGHLRSTAFRHTRRKYYYGISCPPSISYHLFPYTS